MRISMYSRHGYIMYTLLTQTLKKEKKGGREEKGNIITNAQCIANGRETLGARCFHSERNHSA
jgi:hypothetical protein